ncbi:MAG: class I SAM-dependent methyltransferase [Verrucomicrobia bacterium]|nr:MAG: class I SAM-dependent methyltransferase [Verrucomicrobiota bacterium]
MDRDDRTRRGPGGGGQHGGRLGLPDRALQLFRQPAGHETAMSGQPSHPFDPIARQYEAVLDRALAPTGEGRAHFAQRRVAFLRECLERLGARCPRVLDFGCGDGATVPLLATLPGVESVTGVDPSPASLAVARERHGGPARRFLSPAEAETESAVFDLVYTNGVFHHIEPAQRPPTLAWIRERLKPGGWLAFWENNPWNPGVRWLMRRTPFDADARPLSAAESRRLIQAAGFRIERTDFWFLFPRVLRWLRWLERPLSPWPLGGQYQVLARKPSGAR